MCPHRPPSPPPASSGPRSTPPPASVQPSAARSAAPPPVSGAPTVSSRDPAAGQFTPLPPAAADSSSAPAVSCAHAGARPVSCNPSKEMDQEHQGDNLAGHCGGAIQWTSAMSTFMLNYLSQLVASGTKTSSGFKQVHLNSCARALNEHLGVHVTGTQVSNHLRKWKKIYGKIGKLKNLSAAHWDEESCTIILEREHYIGHIQDHREDANYLNKPIEHYHEMATIFGNSLATGAYAKEANDPLATEVTETENAPKDTEDASSTNDPARVGSDEVTMSVNNNGGESSGTKPPPPKKGKVTTEDPNIALVSSHNKCHEGLYFRW